jgi:hypothetical protein
MSDPRYPIGKFQYTPFADHAARQAAISDIRDLPRQLHQALHGKTDAQLDTPYRDGGWTVRQLIHHIADSHMNAFIRFRLGLTEQNPTVKPYDEQAWSLLPDASLPIAPSLAIIENLHHRWTVMLELTPEAAFDRHITHPEIGELDLNRLLQLYSWHSRHHLAHVLNAPI